MKKIFALGLTVVMAANVLTGCGKGASDFSLDKSYADYVKLCDYKGIEATKVKYEVTDDEVQEEIEYELYEYVEYEPITDRGVQEGDYANITYDAAMDGKAAEDYSSEEEDVLVGEGYIYAEVEKALIGMKTGDEKTVEVKLTEENAEEEDIGKTLSVTVVLNEITVEKLPDYNEDFVKENTEFSNTEDYESFLRKQLEESKEEEYKYAAVEEIIGFILDNSEFEGYPQELYDQCEESYNSMNAYYAAMYDMAVEEYLDVFGMDEEAQKQDILDSVNYELVIRAIALAENITCTEKEISDFIVDSYEDYGYESKEEFEQDYSADDIGYQIIYEKVVDFLYENASYTEISEEEYLKEQEAQFDMDMEDEDGDEIEELQGDLPELENGAEGDKINIDVDDTSDEQEK
ncbi:MAG: FKBP-type peptidyl-prolyl cis-trans isomerase [Lachnospiraceae bacterium]|nr:FKBP-type peptidyl-prolyl cis-trans isomerase [Lachnospiraceae bacterium]MDE6624911.1 FKBP-type peptidyl-prolyl cis-trans isomerase [Lachnospiraceae bacterium]